MEKLFGVGWYGTASSAAASWRPRTPRCKSTRKRVPLVVPALKRPAEADDEGACEQMWKTSGKASAGGHHSPATVEEEMTLGASTFSEARAPARSGKHAHLLGVRVLDVELGSLFVEGEVWGNLLGEGAGDAKKTPDLVRATRWYHVSLLSTRYSAE
jgi:hypothetical protein